jgi:hypothetical protein
LGAASQNADRGRVNSVPWTKALHALAADADAAGMKPVDRKPPKRADGQTPHERVLGAWAEVQNALYRASGTPSVTEAGHRLRFNGMNLRITDVIVALRDLREQISKRDPVSEGEALIYEELARRAVLSIREASERG